MDDRLPEAIGESLDRMISRTTSKLIGPILTAAILRRYLAKGTLELSEQEMREAYTDEVCLTVREVLGHDLHVGGEYEDAYSSRTLPKYGVILPVGRRLYRITPGYAEHAAEVIAYIQQRIPSFIASKLGPVTALASPVERIAAAADPLAFLRFLDEQMQRSPAHFEIVSFAVLRVHLEKFACKIYRSTRTSSRDRGVDIATDYGAVYQIKKMRLRTEEDVQEVYSELLTNFDEGRLQDKKVVLVIDDLSSTCRQFLIDMRVQPLVRKDLVTLAGLLTDAEDRQKVLRVVYDEFEREYRSDICMTCRVRPRIPGCQFIPSAPLERP